MSGVSWIKGELDWEEISRKKDAEIAHLRVGNDLYAVVNKRLFDEGVGLRAALAEARKVIIACANQDNGETARSFLERTVDAGEKP